MPAIITHDTFGQDIYKEMHGIIGDSRDELDAFLVGNQGPDPLFYSALVPRLYEITHLGTTMHHEKPNEILAAFKQSLSILDEQEYPVGHAYMLGFLCHYLLDSTLHPLVFFHEYRLCDAGVEGLSQKDKSEVHAFIESELDEMVLFTKRGETIAHFDPSTQILKGSDFVLDTISKMYAYTTMVAFGMDLPKGAFKSALKSFRRVQAFFYSRTGMKREIVGRIEELFRPHSFYRSMSPRALELTESAFDNHEHEIWENPFTGKRDKKDFWDLYAEAQKKAKKAFKAIDGKGFDTQAAQKITNDLDFSGEPTVAILIVEERK